ncbi:glutathione S-transferase C-terminal domain-containing protein homolog [Galleria mellonella]|uniref:Glutathione S-transferase C-terminal domain-containing protein homolog n=1 Tax=Galleria mellonella TaxID=7137 RepID=A0A6J1WMA2_GALME|nr:glutathione S-transferase C-terminal domain-containing protein homolog [Galleria mellonella]
MENIVFLETNSTSDNYKQSYQISLPLQSYIIYCIYKYCAPDEVDLCFVSIPSSENEITLDFCEEKVNLHFTNLKDVPWQVKSCAFPVTLYGDTIITGLCAVARHICKYRTQNQSSFEHEEGLLGFRKGCLQAPNEVSIWTKFCEVDLLRTIKECLSTEKMCVLPKNMVRFENHLRKPVRVHNVYKVARDIKKETLKKIDDDRKIAKEVTSISENTRTSKTRKWKSNIKKQLEVDCSIKIEDLNISHQFAEGPFFTLADLILLPSYYIIAQSFGTTFESVLPLTSKWFTNVMNIPEIQTIKSVLDGIRKHSILLENLSVPTTDDVSLYKCDPKRQNPKKRLFTKPDDIENALSTLVEGMELNVKNIPFDSCINWSDIPDGANPTAGHLPDERVTRKSQQLENLALAVLNIAKEGDVIVDFCSGSGHLGILIAYLLPKCTVILLENKEQSLLRARQRVHDMGLKNVLFFQCNLDFFIGKFDIGIALHACGIASDLVLDKCLKVNAKFVLCPCCYGSLHATDRLVYPRSCKFSNVTIDQYLCIGHAADQTHKEHPLTIRGARCMAIIDSDRGRLAEEFGYTVTLSRLKPLSCTPKNNLLIGVPS